MIVRGLGMLAVVVATASLQGCGNLKNMVASSEKDDRSAGLAGDKVAQKEQSAADSEAAMGKLTLNLPADGDFDKVVVDVCGIGRSKKKGHWKHDREPKDWKEKPEWVFDEPEEDAAEPAADDLKPIEVPEESKDDAKAEIALHEDKEVNVVDDAPAEPQPEPDVQQAEMPKPGHPGHHFGLCRKHVKVEVAFKTGEPVLVEGVPFGPVIVHVALLKADKVVEAGFGKAMVKPGEVATAKVYVFPISGNLEVEIVRLGEEDANDWSPLKPKHNDDDGGLFDKREEKHDGNKEKDSLPVQTAVDE